MSRTNIFALIVVQTMLCVVKKQSFARNGVRRTIQMIMIDRPGYRSIEVENVVLDFNGTIAEDGIIIEIIKEKIKELSSRHINIFILTADTYGTVAE